MLTPHQVRGAELRMAEFQLRERGITVTGTAANAALCPAWIQVGFELYRKLEKAGFKKYPEKDSPYQILETHPHACYCVMAGQVPLAKPSLEGRLQRQLILHERGLYVKDPMDFFEEITRYKLIKGVWPMELLYLPEQLDALAAIPEQFATPLIMKEIGNFTYQEIASMLVIPIGTVMSRLSRARKALSDFINDQEKTFAPRRNHEGES